MNDETKGKLRSILSTYDDKLEAIARREEAIRKAHVEFPDRFATAKTSTILPALEELREVLSSHGHEATLVEHAESPSAEGGVAYAAVALHIVPKPFAGRSASKSNNFIEITFSANRTERKVVVSSSNTTVNARGSHGKRGAYEVEELTGEVVTGHIVQTLEAAFGDRA